MTLPDYDAAREDYEQAWHDWAAQAVFYRVGGAIVAVVVLAAGEHFLRLLPGPLLLMVLLSPVVVAVYRLVPTRKLRREFERGHALDDYVRRREHGGS